MKRLILAAAITAALIPSPAHADDAKLYHYMPDDGYDADIRVACNGGAGRYIPEGYSAGPNGHYCAEQGGVESIYVRTNEELWCKGYDGVWRRKFDAAGWHPVSSSFEDGVGCTLRRD